MEREEYIALRNKLVNDYSLFQKEMYHVCEGDCIEMQGISPAMSYYRICGIESTEGEKTGQLVESLYSLNISFSFVVRIKQGEIHLYLGCDESRAEAVKELLQRLCGAKLSESYKKEAVFEKRYKYAGVLVGDVGTEKEIETKESPLDQLMSYRIGVDCAVVISCCPLSNDIANDYLGTWEHLGSQIERLASRQTTIRDERETVTFCDINNSLVRFRELTEMNINKYKESTRVGLFSCSVKYYAENENTCDIIAGIFMANNQQNDLPVFLHKYNLDISLPYDDQIIITLRRCVIGDKIFSIPIFSNMYTSEEVAFFVRLPKRDAIGFDNHVMPYFEVSREQTGGLLIGDIVRHNTAVGKYHLPVEDMNRHIFISGMTGAGKTNTLQHILMELSEINIPWLCIEPAKTEYFSLYKYGVNSLKIVVAGSKDNPLFINPFEPINKEISLQTHIESLYAALISSFTWVSPLPYILENCLYRVYEECGFDLEEPNNCKEISKYPTIELLYAIIPMVVKEMGYAGRMEQDIISSMRSRISTLRKGTKGGILNVDKSMDLEQLFQVPTIIELEQIGDNDVKSFIMSMLMIMLREYRMNKPDSQLEVKHFLVIEEAHRLLKNIPLSSGENGDPKENGVRFFTDMLNELRSKGQGFIIADQIPEQLAPAVLKNTNLKICHRLVSRSDAKLVGDTIHASDEQISYMSNLKRGVAEVFSEGDIGPKLVRMPNMSEKIIRERINIGREEILKLCKWSPYYENMKAVNRPFPCLLCTHSSCEFIDKVEKIEQEWEQRFREVANDTMFEEFCIDLAVVLRREADIGLYYCVLGSLFKRNKIANEAQVYYMHIAKDVMQQ